jgi:hypothetical protein
MNQLIALILIVAVWAGLLAAYVACERIRRRASRDRLLRSIERWRVKSEAAQ